jgi:hypothetical protein
MTGGPRLSAAASALAPRWAGGSSTGWLGQAAALGCIGEKKRAAVRWAAAGLSGLKKKKDLG